MVSDTVTMSDLVLFHTQLSSIMEVLAKAAVAEISKLFDEYTAVLRLETSQSRSESEVLKCRLQLMENTSLKTQGSVEGNENERAWNGSVDILNRPQLGEYCAFQEVNTSDFGQVFPQQGYCVRADQPPSGTKLSHLQEKVFKDASKDMKQSLPEPSLVKQEQAEGCYGDPPSPPAERQLQCCAVKLEQVECSVQPAPLEGTRELGTQPVLKREPEIQEPDAGLEPTQREPYPGSLGGAAPPGLELLGPAGSLSLPCPEYELPFLGRSDADAALLLLRHLSQPTDLYTAADTSHELGWQGHHIGAGPRGTSDSQRRQQEEELESRGPLPGQPVGVHHDDDDNLKVTGERAKVARTERFVCEYCGKGFPFQSYLKRHVPVHTGERPHGCPRCGLRFIRLSHLRRHEKLHVGIRPFACPLCSRRFSRKSHLEKHLHTHA